MGKPINGFINVQSILRRRKQDMAYQYLSDSELINEIDVINKLVETLTSQAEKLTKLMSEGKVSDSTYRDILEELRKRAAIIIRKMDELLMAVDDKVKMINSQIAKFKYDLELLEIRHAIGAIPDTKYNIVHERVQIQLNEIEGTKKGIVELVSRVIENSRSLGQYVPDDLTTIPQMPAQPATEPAVKPLKPDSVSHEKTLQQSESEIMPVEVLSKPKVIKCSRCGREILENASYCYYCGSRMMV